MPSSMIRQEILSLFFKFTFGIFLLFAAKHEQDGFWTPIFAIWGLICVGVSILGMIGFPAEIKKIKIIEQFEKDQKNRFENQIRKYPIGYKYTKRKKPLELQLRNLVLEKTNANCFYCPSRDLNNIDWEIDHVYPHIKGGTDHLENLVPACKQCNQEKFADDPILYLVKRWTWGFTISKYSQEFLESHRNKSLAYLTNDPKEKAKCDLRSEDGLDILIDLVLENKDKVLSKEEKDLVLSRAQKLINRLFLNLFEVNAELPSKSPFSIKSFEYERPLIEYDSHFDDENS